MNIQENFLTINPYSRPGRKLDSVKAIVIHWLAVPWQTANACRNYFESLKDSKSIYGSAQYIINHTGEIIQCMPADEVAYHCGSSMPDPESGKIYTDLARERFGIYTISPKLSPNLCTIGIEHCHIDARGQMTAQTVDASAELCAILCKTYGLDPLTAIMTHKQVVGWKSCPKWYVDHPEDFQAFKALVKNKMEALNGTD